MAKRSIQRQRGALADPSAPRMPRPHRSRQCPFSEPGEPPTHRGYTAPIGRASLGSPEPEPPASAGAQTRPGRRPRVRSQTPATAIGRRRAACEGTRPRGPMLAPSQADARGGRRFSPREPSWDVPCAWAPPAFGLLSSPRRAVVQFRLKHDTASSNVMGAKRNTPSRWKPKGCARKVVGVSGLEPPTSASRTLRSKPS